MHSTATSGDRVWAHTEAHVRLFAGSEQVVARALAAAVDPQALQGPMDTFHAALQGTALSELDEPEPGTVAELIDARILQVSHDLNQPDRGNDDEELAVLRRLLEGCPGPRSQIGHVLLVDVFDQSRPRADGALRHQRELRPASYRRQSTACVAVCA